MKERAINPKLLLAVGGVVLVVCSAIAIFFAVGYQPDSGEAPSSTAVTSTPAGR